MRSQLTNDYHPTLRPSTGCEIVLPGSRRRPRLAMDEEPEEKRDMPIEERVRWLCKTYGVGKLLKMLEPEDVEEARRLLGGAAEDDLSMNDPTRRAGEMPMSAMDKAIAMTPELARIGIGVAGSYAVNGRGRGSGSLSTKTIAEATQIAPGLSTIGYGAI
jgi:hypothetical protein